MNLDPASLLGLLSLADYLTVKNDQTRRNAILYSFWGPPTHAGSQILMLRVCQGPFHAGRGMASLRSSDRRVRDFEVQRSSSLQTEGFQEDR